MISANNLRLLKRLNLFKLSNILLVHASFYFSRWFKKNVSWGMPYAFSVEPTTSCNLRCPECPSGLRSFSRDTGSVSVLDFKKVVEEYKRYVVYLNLYFQGEPYLNKDFLSLVYTASENNIYTSTSTNAHYLTPEKARETVSSGLDRLIISIDGTTQETYQQYRVGGDLKKVLTGIRNIVNAKKELKSASPHIVFQFLVVKPNEHQIEEVKHLAKEYEVDEVTLKTAQIYEYKNGSPLIPENEKYARYIKQKDGTFKLKHELKDECWKMWHSNVLTWDGNVVPCCFDKDAKYVMGNIHKTPLKKIWKGKKYTSFRKQLWQNRASIDICQNCTEGAKVFSEG